MLLADLGHSFMQYYQQPFDGDVVPIVAPSEHNSTVLTSPFGGKALIAGEHYAGSNRYFAHQTMYSYFRIVPVALQSFLSPISSIYASAALFKLVTHILLMAVIAAFIIGHFKWWRNEFLAICVLITPFFQTEGGGFYHNIGIIDQAVTYTFFYAFPIALLLLVGFAFYRIYVLEQRQSWTILEKVVLPLLMVYLAFSGPLIPPLVILAFGWFVLAKLFALRKQIFANDWSFFFFINAAKWHLAYALFFVLLCIYSHFLSGFNSENQIALPLLTGLNKLGVGIVFIATSKLAIPLILLTLIAQFVFIKKYPPTDDLGKRLLRLLPWLWLFLLTYLLLLPLGGVRDYRPNFIRHDTFIPITLGLIFTIGILAKIFWQTIPVIARKYSVGGLMIVALTFTLADGLPQNNYKCERATLLELATEKSATYTLQKDCTFFSWGTNSAPELQRLISEMLVIWNIRAEPIELVRN
ncbi:MAG: hypothetical protein AB8G22_02020 [Saprospiraceae bacterium]